MKNQPKGLLYRISTDPEIFYGNPLKDACTSVQTMLELLETQLTCDGSDECSNNRPLLQITLFRNHDMGFSP
ncbi:MAG: hypothetical protein RMK89_08945 [Armatimonadota bacterium]|nr:hypothetical protein [Armatimonadota bacterium]MDW8143573.1 hypothetical protein [Armatimonadota bacterium]